jgi:hypothetical protein
MATTFFIDIINEGEGVTITNNSTGTNVATPVPTIGGNTVTPEQRKLKLNFTGTLNGTIISYEFTKKQIVAFALKTPIILSASILSDGKYTVLPDDFYRIQLFCYEDLVIQWRSFISTLCSYSYVQKSIHDKIVHTERIIGGVEKTNIHSMVIHLEALEILGHNPPISMENTVVARLKYLKTI